MTGKGARGTSEEEPVAIGNAAMMLESSADIRDIEPRLEQLRSEGQTVMMVAIAGSVAGLIGVADPIKATTPEALKQLHEEGFRIIMLTGDSRATAERQPRQWLANLALMK